MAALDHVMLCAVYLTSGTMQAKTMTNVLSLYFLYYLLIIFLFNHL